MSEHAKEVEIAITVIVDGKHYTHTCANCTSEMARKMAEHVLSTWEEPEVLEGIFGNERFDGGAWAWAIHYLVGNPNLSEKLSDLLIETFIEWGKQRRGKYLREYMTLLQNPCLTGSKLDELAKIHEELYFDEKHFLERASLDTPDVTTGDDKMLLCIANNPSVLNSTLKFLCNFPAGKVRPLAKQVLKERAKSKKQ